MALLSYCLALALGLCLGSFLNVVIYRLPRGLSIVRPGSRCGFCRSAVAWFSNIPVVSYLWQHGACRTCGHFFSVRYPVVELLLAVFFVVLFSLYGWSNAFALFALFSLALVAASFIDLEFKIIPDEISLGGWAVGLVLAALSVPEFPVTFQEALWASIVGSGFFFLISRLFYLITQEMGLGDGDVKLMGFIGAFLGFEGIMAAAVVGSISGTAVSLFMMKVMGRSRKAPIPFGPFLALGALFPVFGLKLWWNFNS